MMLGKFDPDHLIPQTWGSIAAVPVITGTVMALTGSPVAAVSTLAACWVANQYRTRHERDGYLFASPLPSLLNTAHQASNEMTELLSNYGIADSKPAGTQQGPVLTRHLIKLATGTRLGKLPTEDMARDLGVPTVQVAANAGRGLIGLDIPRPDRQYPNLADLLASPEWQNRPADMLLPCCPAVDQFSTPVVFDIASLPHLITAGTTGSGKSVFVNAMLQSLKASNQPFKLLIADGKGEDFAQPYADDPHLLTGQGILPIATEIPDMRDQVEWLTREMDNRLKTGKKPYPILFVCDELADIVMQDDKEKTITKSLARIAQKARSARIHMLLITQYPTTDVVHPLIAANTPSRAGLLTDKDYQSRVIIGDSGCETLLGKGDCLLKIAGQGLKRIHGALLQ